MDTQISNWEMAYEPNEFREVQEGIAFGPTEPFYPSIDEINLN